MNDRTLLGRALLCGGLAIVMLGSPGCTLWKVFNSPLEPVGATGWEVVGEHAQRTGRHRHRIATTEVVPGFGTISVSGSVEEEAEMEPWYAYRTVRSYEREVETIFTAGKIDEVTFASDPDGRGGYEKDTTDLGRPPAHVRRSRAPIWTRIPCEQVCDVEWSLSEPDGKVLSFGQTVTEADGSFQIQLPAGTLGASRRQEPTPRTLQLLIEGQPPHLIEIAPEIIQAVSRDLEG